MSQREEDDTSTFSRITESDPLTNPRNRIILCRNVRVLVQGQSYVVARQKASNFHTAACQAMSLLIDVRKRESKLGRCGNRFLVTRTLAWKKMFLMALHLVLN